MSSSLIYVEIGDVAEIDGVVYKCVPGYACLDCEITYGCLKIACTAGDRIDHKEVVFKKQKNESNR